MKLQIDTINKTITVLSQTPILEVINFLKNNKWEDWAIEPETKVEWITPTPHVPYIQRVDPYCPPYEITCSTT